MMKLHKMSWVQEFRDFASDTTAHGVKNIFEGPNKFVKLLFFLSWLAASIYTCYIIISSIITFVGKPVGTKYEVLIDNRGDPDMPQTVKFPTITVCSKNKVKRSFLEKKGNELIKQYWEAMDMYDKKVLEKLKERMENPADEMSKLANITYEDVIREGGPESNRLLLCSQRTMECHMLPEFKNNPYFVRETTITGNCWRINPDGLIFGKAGDWGVIRLVFWADLKDYALRSADEPSYGYLVAFHDSGTFGSTLNSGFVMSPGSSYKVDLSLKEEFREPPPGGRCNESITSTSYGDYNEGACVMECKDRYLHKKCGCVNVKPPLKGSASTEVYDYRSCTLSEWAYCRDYYLEWAEQYRNPFPEPSKPKDFCACSTACHEIRYAAQVSSSGISPAYAKVLSESSYVQRTYIDKFAVPELDIEYKGADDVRNNVMVLDVQFTSMTTSQVKQIVTYTKNNLLGDIGGVLGLFLGASVFTIIEFFQFLFFAIARRICPSNNKPKKLPSNEML